MVDPTGITRLTPTALTALRTHWPTAPGSYTPDELAALRTELLRLRDRLRHQPSGHLAHRPAN